MQPPSVTVGPRPNEGSQPRPIENAVISRMPSTKVGSDMPTSEPVINMPLGQDPRCNATNRPAPSPSNNDSSVAAAPSSIVAGRRSPITATTGRWAA